MPVDIFTTIMIVVNITGVKLEVIYSCSIKNKLLENDKPSRKVIRLELEVSIGIRKTKSRICEPTHRSLNWAT